MGPAERARIFRNIARLRRAQRSSPNPGAAAVRHDLEDSLGGTVSRNLASNLLGVSHTALNNWIKSGDVPVVISERGRKEVSVEILLDLHEKVSDERRRGTRRRHFLEPPLLENRKRAERMRPGRGLEIDEDTDPHRRSELRGLAYHRALAPRLRRPMIDEAARKISRWQEEGRIDPRYAEKWRQVLAKPVPEIRRLISTDDTRGNDLRQNSPFAGLLSEPERRRI